MKNELLKTIAEIAVPGKGILAADESTGTITKRFNAVKIESTENTRRDYREMLLTAPQVERYIAGVILYEETLKQKTSDGTPFPQMLAKKGIVPGIKVDKGPVDLPNFPGDKITEGLDGLATRLADYKNLGARFAKWRAVIAIGANNPKCAAIEANAEVLARYAAICQSLGIVPIVEPEVLMDGDHALERCLEVTDRTLKHTFVALTRHRVLLEGMILKPNMVVAGAACGKQATVKEVAEATLQSLRRYVPAAVPTINFLSGGQSDELATAHLNAMNQTKCPKPWNLSFSYARALQAAAMKTWAGRKENVKAAQEEFIKRAKLNSLATHGQYQESLEKEAVAV